MLWGPFSKEEAGELTLAIVRSLKEDLGALEAANQDSRLLYVPTEKGYVFLNTYVPKDSAWEDGFQQNPQGYTRTFYSVEGYSADGRRVFYTRVFHKGKGLAILARVRNAMLKGLGILAAE
jgi:hypothetical protein